jgi:hypothetical protein
MHTPANGRKACTSGKFSPVKEIIKAEKSLVKKTDVF